MRTSRSVRVAVLLAMLGCSFAAATASAQSVYYLRKGPVLALDPPPSGATAAILALRIPSGEELQLGSFTSDALAADLLVGEARAVIYLGTGRLGMDGCARVVAEISRLTGAAITTVASGAAVTTIPPRRDLTEPIIVPMALGESLLGAAGDRLVADVRIGNQCGSERTVSLLYDSPGRASRIELAAVVATTTTSTSTTSTTIQPTCLETATGLAAVRCRLDAMDEILRGASPAALGGVRFAARLARRVDRALTFVRAAQLVDGTPRRLRRARRQLQGFAGDLARGRRDGRVAPEIGAPLDMLAADATAALDTVVGGA